MADDIDKIAKAIMRDFGDFIFTRSQDNITDMGIDDTGALRLSGEIKEVGGQVIIEYTAPYAKYVNDGTNPHPIDPSVLLAWVERKLSVPFKDIQKVARRIAAKIRRFGTEPKPFMDNAIAVAKEKYKGFIDLT